MRELKFKVSGQKIQKDPSCNFRGIIAGTKNYLVASFSFSADWSNTVKVAVFKRLNKEYPAKIVNGRCNIPEEALTWRNFSVYVVGQRKDMRIKTNTVMVEQEVV